MLRGRSHSSTGTVPPPGQLGLTGWVFFHTWAQSQVCHRLAGIAASRGGNAMGEEKIFVTCSAKLHGSFFKKGKKTMKIFKGPFKNRVKEGKLWRSELQCRTKL